MRRRIILAASAIVLLGAWWWDASRRHGQSNDAEPIEFSARGMHREQQQDAGVPESMHRVPGETPEQEWDRHSKFINIPIVFYGRVVDQDLKPLSGAKVKSQIEKSTTMAEFRNRVSSTTICQEAQTGEDGRFTISGGKGYHLSVTDISIDGYRMPWQNGSISYERTLPECHRPNPDAPIDFIMIRDDLPSAEMTFDRRLRIKWNSDVINVDLGEDIGSVVLSPYRNGFDPSNRRGRFDWKVDFRANGFEFASVDSMRPIVAPKSGYQSGQLYDYPKASSAWTSRISRRYAIRTTKGLYGLMILSINGDGSDGGMSGAIEVYLNRSGKRNIDYK